MLQAYRNVSLGNRLPPISDHRKHRSCLVDDLDNGNSGGTMQPDLSGPQQDQVLRVCLCANQIRCPQMVEIMETDLSAIHVLVGDSSARRAHCQGNFDRNYVDNQYATTGMVEEFTAHFPHRRWELGVPRGIPAYYRIVNMGYLPRTLSRFEWWAGNH